jgi:hypothetical protein
MDAAVAYHSAPETAGEAEAPNEPVSLPTPDPETHFVFESRLFAIPGLWFALTSDLRDAAAFIPMGTHVACVPLPKLGEAFGIKPLSHDGEMLGRVARALDHVARVSPGERIPTEIVDGTASWKAEAGHVDAARVRLALALAAASPTLRALLGPVRGGPGELAGEGRVGEVLAQAPAALGIEGDPADLARRVGEAVHECAYVEALRERVGMFGPLADRIGAAVGRFAEDREMRGFAVLTQALVRRPGQECRDLLSAHDARVRDPARLVGDWPREIGHVRHTRDRVHRIVEDWTPVERAWEAPPGAAADLARLLRETHHYAALRYSNERVWARAAS